LQEAAGLSSGYYPKMLVLNIQRIPLMENNAEGKNSGNGLVLSTKWLIVSAFRHVAKHSSTTSTIAGVVGAFGGLTTLL
jgi:hypothetical protein